MNEKDKSRKEPQVLELELKWGSESDLDSIYVNQMTINHAGGEFYLVFGELVAPVILKGQEVPKELIITPKVRLVLTPEAMRNVNRAIMDNLDKYDAHKKE